MQVVIPVKSFKQAKKRLASVLTVRQRSELTKHMLEDVLTSLGAMTEVARITVVTSDSEVKSWLRNHTLGFGSALKVCDPKQAQIPADSPLSAQDMSAEVGLCHAYCVAAVELLTRGADTMLFLPADIPLLATADIQALLAKHSQPGVSLAVAGADGGTNALLVSPPDIIAPAFGERSCQRHIARAREQGLEPNVITSPGLGLDIDTVEDIRALLASGKDCATLRYLHESGITGELGRDKRQPEGHLSAERFQQGPVTEELFSSSALVQKAVCKTKQSDRQVG
ncbi:MAG: 2-phospho-L-lactate guanylyltransferase [Candidatus Reddybacter sp.]